MCIITCMKTKSRFTHYVIDHIVVHRWCMTMNNVQEGERWTTLCSNNNVRKQCALGQKKGRLTIFLSTLGCTDAGQQWTTCKRIGKLVLAKLLCSLVFPDKVHNHVMALNNPQSQVHAIWLATLWFHTNVHDTVHEDVKPMYSLSYCAHCGAQIVYKNEQCARGCKVGLLATWFTTLWFHNNEHNNSVHENIGRFTRYTIEDIVVQRRRMRMNNV